MLFLSTRLYIEVFIQEVPKDYYTLPLGKADLLSEGNQITIITYGAGVHWALDTLKKFQDIKADLIDS